MTIRWRWHYALFGREWRPMLLTDEPVLLPARYQEWPR